jgi:hypothetical protein
MRELSAAAILTACMCVAAPAAFAQGTDDDTGWEHAGIVYLLAPTIEGDVGIGELDSPIEIDPSEVIDTLRKGFLGGWVAENGVWGYMVDVVYMDLEEDFEVFGDTVPGQVRNEQFIAGANVLYNLTDSLQFMGGLSYTDVSLKLRIGESANALRLNVGESWVDPMVGLRYRAPIGQKWNFESFGQVGGFGVGADFTWQFAANFNYRMTKRTSLMLGYRYVDFDFEDGAGPDRFSFDVAEHGFLIGLRVDL